MKLTRRETLTLGAMATAAGIVGAPALAFAKDGDVLDVAKLMAPAGIPDRPLGNPDAKVTLIEYASPTCPHCATFANNVLGPLQEKYVATGQVRFVLRPFARNTMDAAIFMLAEAAAKSADAAEAPADTSAEPSAEPSTPAEASAQPSQAGAEAYENVITTFFRTQQVWGSSDKPLDAVKAVAFQLGFSEASFQEALTNQDYFTAIESMRKQAIEEFGLDGTPTFYLNGKQITGDKTLDELSQAIDPLL